MSENKLTQTHLIRIARAEAITREQLSIAKAIVADQYNSWPDDLTTPLVGAVVQALATNYLAVVKAASGG